MKANNLQKTIFVLILAALFFVPLVFWHGVFFPYTFIKTILFYVITEFAFAIWLLLAVADKEYRPRFSAVTGAVAIFLFIMGIASYAGVDVSRSVWSEYERMFGFITWLHAGLFFLLFSTTIQKEAEWRMVWKVVIGSAALAAVVAIWQGFTASELSISTIGNAAYLSSYIAPVFFLVCMFALQEEHFTKRFWLYSGLFLLFLGALVFTQARAGIVGLLGGGGIAMLLFLFFGNPQERTGGLQNNILKKYTGAAVISIFLLFGSMMFFFPDGISYLPGPFAGLLDFSLENRTTTGRFLVWSVAWEGWKERFLFGWGPENFPILFNMHYRPELFAQEPWFDRAHSFIFDYGSTTGIAGLLAYLGMFGAAGSMIIRKWREKTVPFWHMAMMCSVIGAHLAQNLFTFDTISSLAVVLVIFSYCNFYQRGERNMPVARIRNTSDAQRFFAMGAAAILVMGAVGYFAAARPLFANMSAHRGWEFLRTGRGDEAAIAKFEKSISYGTQYSVDARRFAAEYVFEFLKQGGKRSPESIRLLLEYAIEKMTENMTAEPKNVKWVMYRGELYSLMAQKFDASFAKKAEDDFMRARDMSPGRPQIYLELAQARKMQGDSDKAWEYIDYVLRMAPNFSFGHLNALILAIETGNTVREAEERDWFGKSDELRNEAIRDAYFKTQRYQDAVKIQEMIVLFADKERQTYSPAYRAALYAHLAALYQYANDIENARMAAYKVLELDPNKKSEVEAFLRSLLQK